MNKSGNNLQNAVFDASQFIMENFDLVSHHPLETYSSVLVWLPEQSCIWMKYGDTKERVYGKLSIAESVGCM